MVLVQLKEPSRVKVLIAREGMTLRGFAKRVGVSHTYLSQILNGYKNPSAAVAGKISKGLHAKIEDIFFIRVVDKQPLKEVRG